MKRKYAHWDTKAFFSLVWTWWHFWYRVQTCSPLHVQCYQKPLKTSTSLLHLTKTSTGATDQQHCRKNVENKTSTMAVSVPWKKKKKLKSFHENLLETSNSQLAKYRDWPAKQVMEEKKKKSFNWQRIRSLWAPGDRRSELCGYNAHIENNTTKTQTNTRTYSLNL